MDSIIDIILRLLGRERSIESITNSANKIVRDLDRYADRNNARCKKAEEKVKRAAEKAATAKTEAEDAAELASNWKNSGLIRKARQAAA